jgi:hypothetical protein
VNSNNCTTLPFQINEVHSNKNWVFILLASLFLFLRNRSRLMSSPCSLCIHICVSPHSNFPLSEPLLINLSCHLRPPQWHTWYIPAVSNMNIVASHIVEVIIIILFGYVNSLSWLSVCITWHLSPSQWRTT